METPGQQVTDVIRSIRSLRHEISRVVATLQEKRGVGPGWRFASIDLVEPAKEDLAARPGDIIRTAQAICWDTGRRSGRTGRW